jgi:hypothetical protein
MIYDCNSCDVGLKKLDFVFKLKNNFKEEEEEEEDTYEFEKQ